MSLDRWLGKDLTNSILTPPNSDACVSKVEKKAIRVGSRDFNPRRQLHRARRGLKPNYAAVAMRQLQYFNHNLATVEKLVHTVTGFATHDVLCAGLDGEVLLFDSSQKSYGVVDLGTKSPVRDLGVHGTSLAICTDDAISLADVNSSKITTAIQTNDVAFGFQNIAIAGDLAVTGTNTGSAYICDFRCNQITSTIWDAHDPHRRSRQCQKPRGPALSAVEWCGDNTLATSSTNNQTVKFWDLRKHSMPVNEVAMTQRSAIGGITALKRDPENKIWALGRNGALESMISTQEHPVDVYGLIDCPNYSTGITMIDCPRLATGLVACGGSAGITVLSRPTLQQSYSYDNTILANKWNCAGTFSSVYWHDYSETFVAAGYGTTECFFWKSDV